MQADSLGRAGQRGQGWAGQACTSGWKAAPATQSVWPWPIMMRSRLGRCHTRQVLSSPAVTWAWARQDVSNQAAHLRCAKFQSCIRLAQHLWLGKASGCCFSHKE